MQMPRAVGVGRGSRGARLRRQRPSRTSSSWQRLRHRTSRGRTRPRSRPQLYITPPQSVISRSCCFVFWYQETKRRRRGESCMHGGEASRGGEVEQLAQVTSHDRLAADCREPRGRSSGQGGLEKQWPQYTTLQTRRIVEGEGGGPHPPRCSCFHGFCSCRPMPTRSTGQRR